ncbi:hypothetical protein AB2S62_00445 [Vibrio sp. NTOU-M3]|uniref:hypothetical protein n=1 Tax=Vibrio sp. NTOU-M3 TaxID=3234954 RepID=UPI00349F8230
MCSIGGIVLPFVQASLIDTFTLSMSYVAPALAYIGMVVLYWSVVKHQAKSIA